MIWKIRPNLKCYVSGRSISPMQDLLTSNSGVGINVSIKYIGVSNFYVKTGLNFLQGSSQKKRYRYFTEIDHK